MKTRTFVSILILISAVLIIAGSCAATKKSITEEELIEKFTGVYVSTDYDGSNKFHSQKFEITSEKHWGFYLKIADPFACGAGYFEVVNNWVDRKGNTYCQAKMYFGPTVSRIWALWRLDKSGEVLEQTFWYGGKEKYPEKIIDHDIPMDVDDYSSQEVSLWYNIYHRQ